VQSGLKQNLFFIAVLLFNAVVSPAILPKDASAAGPGTSAASFLKLGFGARPLAMGEAFVSVADDASALHYNPAGLALGPAVSSRQAPRDFELLVSHAMHVQDIRLTQMGLLKRPFGFSATHLSLDGIERRTSETPQPEGQFGASDLALGISYGRKVRGVGVGGTLKIIRQTIGEYSAQAFAVDMGVIQRFDRFPVSVGASIVNLGSQVRFIEEGFPLPLTLRFGATVGLTKRIPHAFSIQVDLPRDGDPELRLGMEYLGFGPFALRAGYRTMSSDQRQAALGKALGSSAPGLSEFYGMFMGAGFRSKLGSMDYTILPYGELGNAHRFSFTVRFGTPKGPPQTLYLSQEIPAARLAPAETSTSLTIAPGPVPAEPVAAPVAAEALIEEAPAAKPDPALAVQETAPVAGVPEVPAEAEAGDVLEKGDTARTESKPEFVFASAQSSRLWSYGLAGTEVGP